MIGSDPKMYIVAGAPGSGKSTVLPVAGFGVDYFNADEEAAKRNHGSYSSIPLTLRKQVNSDFQSFIDRHISERQSFAVETTLRTAITLEQAGRARDMGFYVAMTYIATANVEINLRRVLGRAKGGGHSAPEPVLRSIHESSYNMLTRAIHAVGETFNRLTIFDNSIALGDLSLAFDIERSDEGALQLRTGSVPQHLMPFYDDALANLR